MKKYLEVGDIVIVCTVLGGEREYPVTRIDGNKAYTGFRTFNKKIWLGKNIYELGKRVDMNWYANSYTLKTEQADAPDTKKPSKYVTN